MKIISLDRCQSWKLNSVTEMQKCLPYIVSSSFTPIV